MTLNSHNRALLVNLLFLLALFCAIFTAQLVLADAPPATQPAAASPGDAPAGVDPQLWTQMVAIDARASRITSMVAHFQQEKFTALMRKPIVSSGTIRIKGSMMRWDTTEPYPSTMLFSDREAKIFYPNPAPGSLEIYSLDQRMAEMAASPLPRLKVLKEAFTFAQIPVHDMDANAKSGFLALRMTPREPSLKEHVQEVRVLLDANAGYIVRAEMTDADGDRTVLHFSQIKLNVDPGKLELTVPAGTKVVHPLEGLEGAAPHAPSK